MTGCVQPEIKTRAQTSGDSPALSWLRSFVPPRLPASSAFRHALALLFVAGFGGLSLLLQEVTGTNGRPFSILISPSS